MEILKIYKIQNKNDGFIICPMCKSITELNEYINILRNQLEQ